MTSPPQAPAVGTSITGVPMRRTTIYRAIPIALFAFAFSGCDEPRPAVQLHPLGGRVLREGKPVKDGGLIFVPEGSGSDLIVNAGVEANGRFNVRTERTLSGGELDIRPGAPAGRYKVIYHPASNGATMGLEVEFAERVTVEPGGADIELKLPAVMPKGGGIPRDDNPVPQTEE